MKREDSSFALTIQKKNVFAVLLLGKISFFSRTSGKIFFLVVRMKRFFFLVVRTKRFFFSSRTIEKIKIKFFFGLTIENDSNSSFAL